jgi:2-dehydro-3-deoxyphosphogluconate aldolase/(4S)-4-hydroxy-2-oxoglutarate aldolase
MIPPFLEEVPLIGILRGVPTATALDLCRAAVRGGITVLEVTLNSQDPFAVIEALRRDLPEATIGAGTVMSTSAVSDALHAGARFIVCPHFDRSIVEVCVDAAVPVFPGAMTPTEVWQAHAAGATMVKLFPAGSLGAEYVRALQGPLPQVDLMVTGGIDAGNVGGFIRAGARAAAVGGRLFPKKVSNLDAVEGEARALVTAVRGALA